MTTSAPLQLGTFRVVCWRLVLLLCCWQAMPSVASGIEVAQARTVLEERQYFVNARVVIDLSEEIVTALNNGVSLPVEIRAEVFATRAYVWDSVVARARYRYILQYHPLSKQYLVSNLSSGALENFRTLATALDYLGRVERMPLVSQDRLRTDREYAVRLRSAISAASLPVPLRLRAYLYPSWHLSSDWYQWPL